MSDTRTLRVNITGNAKGGQRALKDLDGSASNTGSKFGKLAGGMAGTFAKMGTAAAAGFAVAGAAAATFVIKAGLPYENTLNEIAALNDLNAKQLGDIASRLEGNASKYAKYGLAVSDAGEGVMELSKAGMSLDDSMKAVDATMILAKAGTLGVGDAAALVSDTLNSFKLEAEDAGRVANVLANAANISSADVSDLQQALQMSGLAAKQAGLSIEETSGMLALLANNGMKGSDAGTSLKTMLLSLQAPSATAAKALEGIGVEVFNAQGKMRPMKKVLEDFLPALDKLSDADRARAIKDTFGTDAYRSANAIFGEGSGAIQKYTDGVSKAGAAQKLAEAKSQGFVGTLNRLKAGAESLAQVIYRQAAPSLAKLGNPVAKGLESLTAKVPGMGKKISAAFSGAGGGAGGGAMAKSMGTIKTLFSSLAPVVSDFGSKLKSILGPAFSSIGNLITTQFLPAFDAFIPAITPIAKFLLGIFGGAVLGVIKGIVNVVKGVIKVITGLVNIVTGILTGDWARVWDGVKSLISGVLQTVIGLIQVWWNIGILSLFKKGAIALLKSGKGIWTGLKNLFSKGMSAIKAVLSHIVNFFTAPFRAAFTGAKSYVTTGWAYIRGAFSGGMGTIRAVLGRLVEVVTWPYRTAFNLAKTIVKKAFSSIKGFFSAGMNGAKSIVTRVMRSIVNGFLSFAGLLLRGASKMFSWVPGVGGKLKKASKHFDQFKADVNQKLAGVAATANAEGNGIGRNLGLGIGTGIDSVAGIAAQRAEQLVYNATRRAKYAGEIKSPSRSWARLGRYLVQGLGKGLSDNAEIKKVLSASEDLMKKVHKAFLDKKITKKQKDAIGDEIGKRTKALVAQTAKRIKAEKALGKATAALAKAQQSLEDAKSAHSGLKDGTTSAMRSYGALGSAMGDGSAAEPNNAASILHRFKQRLANMKAFRGNMTALAQRGFSKLLLEEIANAGPDEGGAMAAALMKATASQMKDFNSTAGSIESNSVGMGNEVADRSWKGIIAQRERAAKSAQTTVNNIEVKIAGSVSTEKQIAKNLANYVREEIERIERRNKKKK